MAKFNINSRYTGGTVSKTREGKDFLILRQPLNLEPSSDDMVTRVTKEILQRPDLLASQAYGDPSLWWVIYEFNNIRDPLFDLQLGQELQIPSLGRVLQAIAELENI